MKKIYLTLSLLAIGSLTFGQGVSRVMLAEEFTNASCGPCAAANPGFNTLLGNNAGKVVAIKYQTDFPGVDPMNAQTGAMVDVRWSYYPGLSGVPHAMGDGNAVNAHPASWNQTTINTRQAVSSPLSLAVSHTFSSDLDSVFITVAPTAASAVNASSAGSLKLRVAMIEKEITFASAPGTNGEKLFHDVMRDMYPDAGGTTLQDAWAVGATQSFTFSRAIPSYIYDKGEIAIVAFVQDDGSREVHQAALSYTPLSVDAKAVSLVLPSFLCGVTTTTGTFNLKNAGASAMTAATLNISVDGTPVGTQPWTGNLASGQSTPVTINNIPVTSPGSHTVNVSISFPGDVNTSNDAAAGVFGVASAPQMLPITQGFETTTFPPTNWVREDIDGDNVGWERRTNANGFGQSTACMRVFFYNSPAGAIDNLYLPKLNLASVSDAFISMSRAAAQYTAGAPENDKVEVQYSTDCGTTWTTAWSKAGTALATAPVTTNSFVPTAAQWVRDTVWLTSACGNADVLLRFKATSDYGNNALFDDINIALASTIAIENANQIGMSVYPNPAKDNVNVDLNIEDAANMELNITSMTGQAVYTQNMGKLTAGSHQVQINTANLAKGTYLLTIKADGIAKSQILTVE